MRILPAVLLFVVCTSFISWETNFNKAKQQATQEHKAILLSFSGSDWCGPCIRLHKDFFDNTDFTAFASSKLVLVNADFPRQKKNQLPKNLQQQNDQLADAYNASGAFPLTVLLSSEGKVWKVWDGYPKMSPSEFMADIQTALDAHK